MEMKDDIFRFGIKNESASKLSWYNLRKFFLRRVNITVFNLLLVGVALVIFGMIISKCPSCSNQECIFNDSLCPVCEENSCEVPKPDKELKVVSTYVCRDGTIAGSPEDCDIRDEQLKQYVCDDGSIAETAEGCKKELVLDTGYQKQDNHLLLAIDGIGYEMKGDDWGTITSVAYAVKNFADDPVLPQIQVKVFNESDPAGIKSETRYTIKVPKTLENDEFVQGVEDVHISFKGDNITAKFVLVNGLDDSPQARVVLERPLD